MYHPLQETGTTKTNQYSSWAVEEWPSPLPPPSLLSLVCSRSEEDLPKCPALYPGSESLAGTLCFILCIESKHVFQLPWDLAYFWPWFCRAWTQLGLPLWFHGTPGSFLSWPSLSLCYRFPQQRSSLISANSRTALATYLMSQVGLNPLKTRKITETVTGYSTYFFAPFHSDRGFLQQD